MINTKDVRAESDVSRFVQHFVAVFEVANQMIMFHFD